MRKILVVFILILVCNCQAQQFIERKNFYLISALDKYPALREKLPPASKKELTVISFRFFDADRQYLDSVLRIFYQGNQKQVDQLLDKDIRPSGSYELYKNLTNEELWLKCWSHYYTGINYIIDQYGLGKKMRYPAIDSVSYEVNNKYYQSLLSAMFAYLQPQIDSAQKFYEVPLLVALQLMQLNNRDELARHEPLEQGENKKTFQRVKTIDFRQFTYSAIVLPGDGPVKAGIPLSPFSILRCQLGAERYHQKLAPFIIVSGGYCHPFQTPFAEAVEMKKYLVTKLGIPENAVIIDPHARHTTTNFRNATRYIINYGMPTDRPVLFVSTVEQISYSMNTAFDVRNRKELGYLPYKDKIQLSPQEIRFYPVRVCLHRDPTDPLDP